MATLTSLLTQFQKLPNQEALVALIDLKTEDDMEKVLNRLDAIDAKFDAKFDAIDAKFDAIDAKLDAKLNALESKVSHIQWFIATVMAFLFFLLKFPHLVH